MYDLQTFEDVAIVMENSIGWKCQNLDLDSDVDACNRAMESVIDYMFESMHPRCLKLARMSPIFDERTAAMCRAEAAVKARVKFFKLFRTILHGITYEYPTEPEEQEDYIRLHHGGEEALAMAEHTSAGARKLLEVFDASAQAYEMYILERVREIQSTL